MGIAISGLRNKAATKLSRSVGAIYSNIELCQIISYNSSTRMVNILTYNTQSPYQNVPYCFPYYHGGSGIMFAPEPGALAMCAFDKHNMPVILAFLPPTLFDEDGKATSDTQMYGNYTIPKMAPGEVLFIGRGRSFIKLGEKGDVFLSSDLGAFISLDKEGDMRVDCEDSLFKVNGVCRRVLTKNYQISATVVEGEHTLPVGDCDEDGLQLVYSVQSAKGGFFGVDAEGNVHLSGKVVQHG